jgi:hypothetical protein
VRGLIRSILVPPEKITDYHILRTGGGNVKRNTPPQHGNSIYFLQFSKTVLLLVSGTIWQGISVQHFTVAKQAE